MLLRATALLWLATTTAACSTMSVLSKSTYDHEQRAYRLFTEGQYEAAAGQRAAAEHDRARMARIGNSAEAPYPRL